MKSGVCPKCKSKDVYHHQGSRFVNEMITLKEAFIGRAASPDKYICATCGYVEYYLLSEPDLQIVRDTWEKVAS